MGVALKEKYKSILGFLIGDITAGFILLIIPFFRNHIGIVAGITIGSFLGSSISRLAKHDSTANLISGVVLGVAFALAARAFLY